MKIHKNLKLLFCLVFLFEVKANAQATYEHQAGTSAISLAIQMPAIAGITDESATLMLNKIAAIVTANGFGTTDDKTFIIYPQFTIGAAEKTSGLMQNFTVVNCNFSLYVKQNSNQVIYASVTKVLRGQGQTKEAAVANAVQLINPDDPVYAKLIESTKQKIGLWYQQNCAAIMLKV